MRLKERLNTRFSGAVISGSGAGRSAVAIFLFSPRVKACQSHPWALFELKLNVCTCLYQWGENKNKQILSLSPARANPCGATRQLRKHACRSRRGKRSKTCTCGRPRSSPATKWDICASSLYIYFFLNVPVSTETVCFYYLEMRWETSANLACAPLHLQLKRRLVAKQV